MCEPGCRRLTAADYAVPATVLAPQMLGMWLCRRAEGGVLRARITETECYFGEEDTACHAHRGRTPRTDMLYRAGGVAYIYLCYGMHALLNVVTGPAEHPEAVLIRGVEGTDGPGRTTRRMRVDCALNGADLCGGDALWLETDGVTFSHEALPRVGIGYASPADQARLWRYRARRPAP